MANLEKGFLFLYDWLPAIENLPAKDAKMLLLSLIDFQRNGVPIPEFSNKKANVYAQMIEPSIRRRLEGKRSSQIGAKRESSQDNAEAPPRGTPIGTPEGTPKVKQSKSNSKSNSIIIAEQSNTEKTAYGEFSNVFLSQEERAALADKYGESVSEGLINNLSIKIRAHRYAIKDHYATILDWANKDGVKLRSEKSYDLDDFFNAALSRSLE